MSGSPCRSTSARSGRLALKAKVFRTTAEAFCRRFITALETPTLRRAA